MTQPETLAKQIRVELEAQPAPRTYEVARALSVLDDFERRSPDKPEAEAVSKDLITLTGNQAEAILEAFGGEPTMVSIRRMEASKDVEDGSDMPAGLYLYYTEYPEEGVIFLGEDDQDYKPFYISRPPLPSDKLRGLVREAADALGYLDEFYDVAEGGPVTPKGETPAELADRLEQALLPQEPSSGATNPLSPDWTPPFVCSSSHREVMYYGSGCPVCEIQEALYLCEQRASPVTDGGKK